MGRGSATDIPGQVPPPPGLPGKLPGSPRPWDSNAPHTLSCFPHPGTVGEPWGCLPSSSLPLHPAWWAAASWGGQLRRRKDNYRQSLRPGLRPGVAACSAFTPTARPLKDSLGHRHPNPRQGTTPPLTECPPGLGSVQKDFRRTPLHPPPDRLRAQDCRVSGQWPYLGDWRPLQTRGAPREENGPRSRGWGHLAGARLPSPGIRRQLGLPAGRRNVKVRPPAHPSARDGLAAPPARPPAARLSGRGLRR